MREVTLIGFGAIGRSIYERLQGHARLRVGAVVVSARSVASLEAELGSNEQVRDTVPPDSKRVLEWIRGNTWPFPNCTAPR